MFLLRIFTCLVSSSTAVSTFSTSFTTPTPTASVIPSGSNVEISLTIGIVLIVIAIVILIVVVIIVTVAVVVLKNYKAIVLQTSAEMSPQPVHAPDNKVHDNIVVAVCEETDDLLSESTI